MKALGLFLGILIAAAACGDDQNHVGSDGGKDSGGIDSGSGSAATLTSFVIDLVLNHGSDATPQPFTAFSDLPDPDGSNNNGSAYSSLF